MVISDTRVVLLVWYGMLRNMYGMVYTHGNMERGSALLRSVARTVVISDTRVVLLVWYGMLRNMYGMVYTHGNMERGSALLRSVARTVVISDTRVVLPTQQELLFEI